MYLLGEMATIKQKLVALKMVENGGSLGSAMREVGYSESMAKNPQKLTKSKGWQEIMSKSIRESELLRVHRQMLGSVRLEKLAFDLDISDEDIRYIISKIKSAKLLVISKGPRKKTCYYTMPDERTRDRALDMAYKVWGKYKDKDNDEEEQFQREKMDGMIARLSALLPDAGD